MRGRILGTDATTLPSQSGSSSQKERADACESQRQRIENNENEYESDLKTCSEMLDNERKAISTLREKATIAQGCNEENQPEA